MNSLPAIFLLEANNPITLQAKIEKGAFTNPKIMVPQVSEKMNLIIEKKFAYNPSALDHGRSNRKINGGRRFSGAASAGKLPARGSFNSKTADSRRSPVVYCCAGAVTEFLRRQPEEKEKKLIGP